jgi:hypothetical protein
MLSFCLAYREWINVQYSSGAAKVKVIHIPLFFEIEGSTQKG